MRALAIRLLMAMYTGTWRSNGHTMSDTCKQCLHYSLQHQDRQLVVFNHAHLAGREASSGWAPAAWLEISLHTKHCRQNKPSCKQVESCVTQGEMEARWMKQTLADEKQQHKGCARSAHPAWFSVVQPAAEAQADHERGPTSAGQGRAHAGWGPGAPMSWYAVL